VTAFLAVFSGILGMIIGSFLNVVIWRVPRGESIVRPPSHCPNCERPIAPRDNLPVASWLILRGRCRHCREPISARYPLVELATGLLFVGFALRFGWDAVLPAYFYLAAIGVALAMIDFDHKRLPDVLTLPSYPVGLALLAIAAAVEPGWWPFGRAAIGMGALLAFYGVLWLVYPAGMGFGDVKLSGIVGMYLGWVGWGALVVGAFAAFFVGGVVGIALILFAGGGRKSKIPFGPFMLVGALIGVFAGEGVAHAYSSRLTG
jgi:leader peptidase (prepilin peptidase) / N-methyltransferase